MLFKNAKIFKDGTRFLEKGFILENRGIIEELDVIENCPKSYGGKIIDCSGFSIYPGFIDAHSHLGLWEDGLDFEGNDGNEETDPVMAHLRAIDSVNPLDGGFAEALQAGITTVVVGPGSANPIGGDFAAIKTFGSCIDDMLIKARVGIKFSLGENPKRVYSEKDQTPITRMGTVALIRESLETANRYRKKLVKYKTKKNCDEPDYDMKSEALIDLLDGKIVAFFHCHRIDDIYTAIRISREFGLKFVLVHATEGYLAEKSLSNINAIVGPIICDKSKPELKNNTPENPSILLNKGAKVAICTDHPVVPSQYLLVSCAIAVRDGMEKSAAIDAITKTPAEICGIYDKVGSLDKGKCANFTVFEKNCDIFSPYVRPSFVVLDGGIVFKSQKIKF